MKSKTWALCLAVVLLACGCLSFFLLRPGGEAKTAQVWSDGELLYTLDLSQDRVVTVETQYGTNVVTVSGGKVGVTQADCPDGYCMARGLCGSGPEIVCLPNRLVIRFAEKQAVDAVAR